jgi:hypothetical protein
MAQWQVIDGIDLNGDGTDEILLKNNINGATGAWTVSSGVVTGFAALNVSAEILGSPVQLAGGLNWGDLFGRDALLFSYANSAPTGGQTVINAYWTLSSGEVTGYFALPVTTSTSWQILSAADLSGDNVDDILLSNPNGENGAWKLTENNRYGSNLEFVPLPYTDPNGGWKMVGSADLDGNGIDDVLLSNSNGGNGAWTVANSQATGFIPLPYIAPGSGWQMVGSADLNGDSTDEILLSNPNGGNGAWVLSGGAVTGFLPLPYTG